MKKILFLVICVLAVFVVTSCDDTPGEGVSVTGVTLTPGTLSLTTGETEQLTADVAPDNATDKSVSYSTSNNAVASVSSSGLVTAKEAGSATITVTTTDGSKTDTCSVTVTDPVVNVTGVILSESDTFTLGTTRTKQLTATILPSTATDKAVTWESDDENTATVSSTGLVTGVAVGTATITVTTNDGSHTDSVDVSVVTYTAVTGISAVLSDGDTALAQVNEEAYYHVEFTPGDATDRGFTVESSDESVVEVTTVNESSVYFTLTATGAGSATITITSRDVATVTDTIECTIVADTTAPELNDVLVLQDNTIYVAFSETMNSTQIGTGTNYAVVLDPDGAATALTVSSVEVITGDCEVNLIIGTALSAGDEIEVTVTGVSDLAGNSIATADSANVDRSTYVPSHGLVLTESNISESNGQLSISTSNAIDMSDLDSHFVLENTGANQWMVLAVPSGEVLSQTTIVGYGMVTYDAGTESGSVNQFDDNTFSSTYVFPNGDYDLYIMGYWDIDDNDATTYDRIQSFGESYTHTVTTGS